jgi:cell wall assembly regulator SMI1
MHFVRKAAHVGAHKLLLTFENGEERVADLAPELDGEVFQPLKDVNYFRSFRVDSDLDTVVWDNGADFSPDFLYDVSRPVIEQTAVADK